MCSSKSPSKPKSVCAPALETPKDVDNSQQTASDDAAKQQAMRRGLSSVWTRYNTTPAAADDGSQKSAKLGG